MLKIKGCRANLWSSSELLELIKEGNLTWAKARPIDVAADWLSFSQPRNNVPAVIKKATSDSGGDPN